MMLRQLRLALHDYPTSWLAFLFLVTLIAWPGVLAPLAQAYLRFCATVFADTSLFHHYPPYGVALLLVVVPLMLVSVLVMVIRQRIGQRQLEAASEGRQRRIDDQLVSIASNVGLSQRLVVVGDLGVYAYCAGVITPRVYVSTGLLGTLSPEEVEAVLQHEAHHLRRHDPLRLMIVDIVQSLAAPFPAVRTLAIRARTRIELAADHAALELVPVEALASALLKVARSNPAFTPQAAVAALSPTEARVAALLGKPIAVPFERRDLIITASVMLTLAVTVGYLLTLPFPMTPFCTECPPY